MRKWHRAQNADTPAWPHTGLAVESHLGRIDAAVVARIALRIGGEEARNEAVAEKCRVVVTPD